jgi:hypothetical protein
VNDEEPCSGNRWDPLGAETPHATADAATESPVAVAEAEHSAWTPPQLTPTTTSAAVPRPGKRRRAIAAAIGVGLLLIGGAAGYVIGHATAATSTFHHERGGPGGFRQGPDGGFGGTAGGGTSTGTGSSA